MQEFIQRFLDCLEAPRVPRWLGDLVNIGYLAGCIYCWPVLYLVVMAMAWINSGDEGK